MNEGSRRYFSVFFLQLESDLRHVQGLPGAVEALQNALVIGREIYEVGDGLLMDTADRLERLLEGTTRTGANYSRGCEGLLR